MTALKIGDRVRLVDVAFAFKGQAGVIESTRADSLEPARTIYVVRLDTPTPAATNWTPLETLGVHADDIEMESEVA